LQQQRASTDRDFATATQQRQFNDAYDSNRARSQDLNRNQAARSTGYDRYNSYQRSAAGARQRPAGRRRR
jgi:hypothetical protein